MFDVGQLVRIRERGWQVLEDHAGHDGSDHVLRVRGEEGDVRGLERTFVYRPGAEDVDEGLEVVEAVQAPELLWLPGTPPSKWERLHMAYRLSAARGSGLLLGLAGSRLEVEPYQLAPVLRVMSAPQQRFLLAEDVGMGKTIEAGLIMMELIARGRGDRILIVVPAALQDQWADELQDKFGLHDFKVLDSDYLMRELIPNLPPGANPWYYANRVITSIDYAKRDRVLPALRRTRWDLVIVDEAHYLAESGTDAKPLRTDRSRFGEMIAWQCESLLLLTATPHSGYAQGFFSLLRLLDDTRFASAQDLQRETIQQAVIRRSKQQILKPDGTHRFKDRTIHHITLSLHDPQMKAQRQLYEELNKYVTRYWRKVKNQPNERVTVGFALTLLKKRFVSSPAAIRHSLQARRDGLEKGENMAPDAGRGQLSAYRNGMLMREQDRERVERQLVTATSEKERKGLDEELHRLDRLITLASKVTMEQDYKTALLKSRLDEFCNVQGRKVIVFTEYKDTLDYLYDYLETHGYAGRMAVMHGHLNREARGAQERKFHEPGTALLLATDAASEGLNFQHGCWTIIHNELPWNPNRLEQRNGRVDRWGQNHDVEIYNMVVQDTLEGVILQRLQDKLEVIRKQVGSVSDVLSVTGPLDLDSLLMEGADTHEDAPLLQAVTEVEQQVDAALREGQEALDACRAQFLIAPGAFGPADYDEVERAQALMRQELPSGAALEQFVTGTLPLLGGQARRLPHPAFWTLDVPPELRGTGILPHYEQATFEREAALRDRERPPTVAFIAQSHPLVQALIAAVKSDARTGRGELSGRMSLRVLEGAPRGMLFTFLGRWLDKLGAVVAEEMLPLFVGLDGSTLLPPQAEELLQRRELKRNPSPALLAEQYEPRWQELRTLAQRGAASYCTAHAEEIARARRPQLELLRRDVEVWQEARLRYFERKLQRRIAEEMQQLSLFEERDRKAAETRRQNEVKMERLKIKLRREDREREIAAMEQIVSVQPEPIGALVIVPAEEC